MKLRSSFFLSQASVDFGLYGCRVVAGRFQTVDTVLAVAPLSGDYFLRQLCDGLFRCSCRPTMVKTSPFLAVPAIVESSQLGVLW